MRKLQSIITSFLKDEEGALFAEYGILVAVLVLGMAAAMIAFRDTLSTWLVGTVGTALTGCTSTKAAGSGC